MATPSKRLAQAAVLLWALIAALVIGVRLSDRSAIDTDVQSMLPAQALSPVIREAIVQAGSAAGSRVAFVVSAKDPGVARSAAVKLERALEASGAFVSDRRDGEQTARWLFANRNELACEIPPRTFDAAAADEQARTSLATLYSPAAPVTGDMLVRDPFLLTLRLAGCLTPAISADADVAVVSGRTARSPYRVDVQETVTATVDAWLAAEKPNGVTLARAGALFHAAAAAGQARGEVSLISALSASAIVLLLLFVFRRPKVLIGTLVVVAVGYLTSIAVTLLLFPAVHLMVFVFGAAFIGMTSDYAIYYLATGPLTGWADEAERRRQLFRPVTVCMITSAVGFACLGLFRVPILDQIATFAAAGLVGAWATAFTLVPGLDRAIAPGRDERLAAWWRRLDEALVRLQRDRLVRALAALGLVVLGALSLSRFDTLDDVRRFQSPSPVLAKEERQVRAAVGVDLPLSFLLSVGRDLDEAKRHETAMLMAMPPADAAKSLSVSRLDPTPEQRAAQAALVDRNLIQRHLPARAEALGLEPAAMQPRGGEHGAALPDWLATLQGRAGDSRFLIAPSAAPPLKAQKALEGRSLFVDPAARYSEAFRSYRKTATWASAAAIVIVGLAAMLIYRTPKAAIIVVAPVIGALGGVVISLTLGIPISFFSVMAMFLVIGTGVDYSVLQWEIARGTNRPSELPIAITASTAILSMGLLSLSSSYPVRSFGVVVAAGLAISYAFSYIPRWSFRENTT